MADEAARQLPRHEPSYLPCLTFSPAYVNLDNVDTKHHLLTAPLVSPLLVQNTTSEVRDLLATERTLLSNLRLATYLAVVGAAIIVQFHLKSEPSSSEKHAALPLGIVFGVLSIICMGMGIGNYAQTVEGYARKKALVQSGVKTQVILGVLGVVVVATCLFFIGVNADDQR